MTGATKSIKNGIAPRRSSRSKMPALLVSVPAAAAEAHAYRTVNASSRCTPRTRALGSPWVPGECSHSASSAPTSRIRSGRKGQPGKPIATQPPEQADEAEQLDLRAAVAAGRHRPGDEGEQAAGGALCA